MLQNHLLSQYAPNALQLLYRPADSGSPGQDYCRHISRHDTHRIDLEDTIIIGGGVIVRIEPDLASMDEKEAEAKIASIAYAQKVLGNNDDAVEFVRCVKLLAGEDARGRDLQIIASHYYTETKSRPVSDVLKEMALLAMQLTSVTSTNDERQFGELTETDVPFVPEPMTQSDRRALSLSRAAQVLGEVELTAADIFQLEIRSRNAYRHNGHTQGFVYDEGSQFQSFLRDLSETTDDETLEAIQESYDRVNEQYDEDHVVSLHMSDGERVVVLGTLDEDVDASYLPEEARHLAADLRKIFVGGEAAAAARHLMATVHFERAVFAVKRKFRGKGQQAITDALLSIPDVGGVETFSRKPLSEGEIWDWMECATSRIYNRRVKRTTRSCFISQELNRMGRVQMFTSTSTIMVNPEAETRNFVQQVLETLLDQMKADFHLRGQRYSELYKSLHRSIRTARDTALVASTIKEAFKAKEERRLSLALFTALNTSAKLQRWQLESERVSAACNRLLKDIRESSAQKRIYLRWAMYGDNQPSHPIHKLPRQEKARVWDALKVATNLPTPVAA